MAVAIVVVADQQTLKVAMVMAMEVDRDSDVADVEVVTRTIAAEVTMGIKVMVHPATMALLLDRDKMDEVAVVVDQLDRTVLTLIQAISLPKCNKLLVLHMLSSNHRRHS
jgi:hypothetical protein